MAEQQPKSFWETLPGVVTAVGGLIAAVATLIGAMKSAGWIGKGVEPVSGAATVTLAPLPASSSVASNVAVSHGSGRAISAPEASSKPVSTQSTKPSESSTVSRPLPPQNVAAPTKQRDLPTKGSRKGPIWVVAIGPFADGEEHMRVVNQLEANGYDLMAFGARHVRLNTDRSFHGGADDRKAMDSIVMELKRKGIEAKAMSFCEVLPNAQGCWGDL